MTAGAGLRGRGWAGDVAVFDYDEDGLLDLFVPSMFGRGQLYSNGGNGTFSDVTAEALGKTSHGAIGSKVFDYDGDGRLDLFVVDMHSDMWMGLDSRQQSLQSAKETRASAISLPERARGRTNKSRASSEVSGQRLRWRARTTTSCSSATLSTTISVGGKFTETVLTAGLETFWPWGIASGDFDNDGDEDVFIPSGMGYPFYYWPNQLMMNNGNGTFRERAAALGVEPPTGGVYQEKNIGGKRAARSSRSAVVADFDGDGRLDIVTNNFNDRPYYFANQFPRENYVAFRLTRNQQQP